METQLTAEQFRNQFSVEVELTDETRKLLVLDCTKHGYPIFRCLEVLLLRDGGKYYAGSHRKF